MPPPRYDDSDSESLPPSDDSQDASFPGPSSFPGNAAVPTAAAKRHGITMPPLKVPPKGEPVVSHKSDEDVIYDESFDNESDFASDAGRAPRAGPSDGVGIGGYGRSHSASMQPEDMSVSQVESASASGAPAGGARRQMLGNGSRGAEVQVGTRPMAGSRSANASFAGGRQQRSEASSASLQEAPHDGDGRDPRQQGAVTYAASFSWQDTLAQFPDLLRLYPSASLDEDSEAEAAAEETLNPAPTGGPSQAADGQDEARAGIEDAIERRGEGRPSAASAPPATTASVPCTPVRPGSAVNPSPHARATASRTRPPAESWGTSDDLAAAWAEIDRERQRLAQRERDMAAREDAVRRAECRSEMAAKHLAELRHRLDDYGRELSQGIEALSLQQASLREERRQAMEMQARARRTCAAAVRDDVIATQVNEWKCKN
eukprot:TRINITY_DN14353_c0_g1_i3.p1 TRINITY_DN14353_c0_g1~~TRINITY_DN14353_c0_g1_i3.p1  ORF type:complete len:432 (-),score=108.92 TRINITY_DN14353_c0_g1_i3:150-1445(-)